MPFSRRSPWGRRAGAKIGFSAAWRRAGAAVVLWCCGGSLKAGARRAVAGDWGGLAVSEPGFNLALESAV
jgi:hypothetical protein